MSYWKERRQEGKRKAALNISGQSGKLNEKSGFCKRKSQDFELEFTENIIRKETVESHDCKSRDRIWHLKRERLLYF